MHRAGIHDPAQRLVDAQRENGRRRRQGTTQEGLRQVGRLARLQLRSLIGHALLHQRVDPLEQRVIAQPHARLLQGVLQVVGERAALFTTSRAREVGLLGRLLGPARGQQDVAPRGDGCPGRARLFALPAGRLLRRHDVTADGPHAGVGLLLAYGDLLGAARARAGVAAVEDHGEVRAIGRHFSDELRQLLVGQIPAPRQPAIVADERLVQTVRLEIPELRRRVLLRAVAAVVEQRHVLRPGLPQMAPPGANQALARDLLVDQQAGRETVAGAGHTRGQQVTHAADIVDAAVERVDRRRVSVNAGKERVNGAGHDGLLRCDSGAFGRWRRPAARSSRRERRRLSPR